MRTLALAMGLVLASATAAQACLPPLPRTAEEEAAAQAQRQAQAWDQATFVFEAAVGDQFILAPGEAGNAWEHQARHVELTPVRVVRGVGEAGRIEMVYLEICGIGPAYSLAPGTRLVAYARTTTPGEPGDLIDLIAVSEITHAATLAALARPVS